MPARKGSDRYRFGFVLGNSERDRMIRTFIDGEENASETIKELIAAYVQGRFFYIKAAAPAESGGGGQVDTNDPFFEQLAGALKRGR